MEDCIFCQIANRQIPKELTYEDEDVMVFQDIHPQKPIHLLIVTKKHIKDFLSLEDHMLFQKLCFVFQRMIRMHLPDKGYRITLNGGGAQEVDHLHFHLLGPLRQAVRL